MPEADISTTQETSIIKSQLNTMLFTLIDMKCLIHFEFDLHGQTLIKTYVELLKLLRVAISGPQIGYWKETLKLLP
jgi:hypothetical protein